MLLQISRAIADNYNSLGLAQNMHYGVPRTDWLAPCVPSLGCLGDSRCALVSTGASQVANQFVRMILLGSPLGDLQLVTLVALITLARTYGVVLRSENRSKVECLSSLSSLVACPCECNGEEITLLRTDRLKCPLDKPVTQYYCSACNRSNWDSSGWICYSLSH